MYILQRALYKHQLLLTALWGKHHGQLFLIQDRHLHFTAQRNTCHRKCEASLTQPCLAYADAAGEVPEDVIGDAYTFLQQQGCINMGVPAGDPDQGKEPEEEPEAFPTDDDIIRALQDILKKADLQVGFPAHLGRIAWTI